MGAKGSKPAAPKRNTIRKGNGEGKSIKKQKVNTRKSKSKDKNKSLLFVPGGYIIPPIDCSQYPPPIEGKIRNNVPFKCLTKEELAIMDREANAKVQKRVSESKPGIPITDTRITWAKLKGGANEGTKKGKKRVYFFKTATGKDYALASQHAIQFINKKGGLMYPLFDLFEKNYYRLLGFCNDAYNTYTTGNRLEDGFERYMLIQHGEGGALTVDGFVTMLRDGNLIYVGDLCVGPKREGLGKHCIEQVMKMVKEEKFDGIELEPSKSSTGFYEKLGFSYDKNIKNHVWWLPCTTAKICRSPVNEKGSGPKNDS